MKTFARIALIVVLLALAIPLTASAQGGIDYTAGVQLQNLSGAQATIVVQFYDNATGNVVATYNDTIAANGSKTFFPLPSVAAGFNGSAVVSSDQPIAAIANVLGNNMQRQASYGGFAAGATSINLPLVMKAIYGNNTWFNVQNAGTAAATVNVAYKPGTCTESISIQPGAAKTFDQSTNTCLPAGFVGAASVSSTEPLVAVVMQNNSNSGTLFSYDGFTSASTNPVMPLVSSNVYRSGTGIQIQNTGATDTNVTVSYTPSAGFPGAACTETQAIPAGQSKTFAFTNSQMPAGCGTAGAGVSDTTNGGFIGSARVTANSASMPLVAIVNQITRSASNGSAYEAFDVSKASNKVVMPLIMDRNYSLFTGFSIANVGTNSTNVACTFSGSAVTVPSTAVAAGSALTVVNLNMFSAGYVGAGTCTATGGDAKIVGIVNEVKNGAPATTDTLMSYDGFN